MVKWPPTLPKIEKNKVVLNCILGHFQPYEQFLFLVENRPIRKPPLFVENSTNFFFEIFPYAYGRAYLTEPVVLTKNLLDSTPAAFCDC